MRRPALTPRSIAATSTHGYGFCLPLLVADDQKIRDLLQRMFAYFIANLLIAQIALTLNPCFCNDCATIASVIGLILGDIQDHRLNRRQPDGKAPA